MGMGMGVDRMRCMPCVRTGSDLPIICCGYACGWAPVAGVMCRLVVMLAAMESRDASIGFCMICPSNAPVDMRPVASG